MRIYGGLISAEGVLITESLWYLANTVSIREVDVHYHFISVLTVSRKRDACLSIQWLNNGHYG